MAPRPAENKWTTGLCECCAEPGGFLWCCYALCCSPCAYGHVVERMPPSVFCGGDCLGACLAYYGLSLLGVPCIIHMMSRGWLRRKYNMPGDDCDDFLITWCCTPCSLCQEHRELHIRGHSPGYQEQAPQFTMVPVPGSHPPPPGFPPQQAPQFYPPPPPGFPPQQAPQFYPPPAQGFPIQQAPQFYPPPPPGFPPQQAPPMQPEDEASAPVEPKGQV